MLGLLISSLALAIAAHQANARAQRLRDHGVPVEAVVTSCLGQLGGSGSNAAGYICRGRFQLDGSSHEEALPGTDQRVPGTKVLLVSDPGHPHDLATPAQVGTLHPGWGAYGLAGVLGGTFVVLGLGGLTYRSGRLRRGVGGV